MGLVQVNSESDALSGSLEVEGAQLFWDAVVEKIVALYGPMTIDHVVTLPTPPEKDPLRALRSYSPAYRR